MSVCLTAVLSHLSTFSLFHQACLASAHRRFEVVEGRGVGDGAVLVPLPEIGAVLSNVSVNDE